jgi:hypothetical protein
MRRASGGSPGRRGFLRGCSGPRRGAWSIAPAHVWERFDEAVERLSRARTGVSVTAIARAFGALSEAAWELAGAVDDQAQQARSASQT